MKSNRRILWTFAIVLVMDPVVVSYASPGPWKMESLLRTPAFVAAEGFSEPGVKGVFYDGQPFAGKPTRVFAWYGVPDRQGDTKFPAMVLVHGGGGTAFAEWVRLWVSRGYCAIAMDTCGCVPRGEYGNWERHTDGGPAGWGGFEQSDAPVEDQWTYHAVADIVLANTLLRSFPEVDAERIGITGISWGGYLTCIAAGVDSRFKLAVPVYGCGFLGDNSAWLDTFAKMPPEKSREWLGRWDPSVYLPYAGMPMLWVTGTNDFAYPLDSLQKSYLLPEGPRTLCIRIRMPHGHGGAGENPEEIKTFVDNHLAGKRSLARILSQDNDANSAWLVFDSPTPVVTAELIYTKDTGRWQDRLWESGPASVDPEKKSVSAPIPDGTKVFYINLLDEEGRLVSSEHKEIP